MAIGRKLSLTPNVKSKKINVTATADQTLFTVTGGYRINNIGVYRNGALLAVGKDFLANDGSTVTLLSAATAGDIVQFEIFDTHDLVNSIGANGDQVLNGALTVTGIVSASSINIGSAITFTDAGINVTGIVTATSFRGDGSQLTGIAATDTIAASSLTVSGISTFTGVVKGLSDVRVSGNLNAGISTFGAVTVTSISGDGSGLTGVANTDVVHTREITTTGVTTFSGDVIFAGDGDNITFDKSTDDLKFNDGTKAVFGTGGDAEIYHAGNNSYITNDTNYLFVQSDSISLAAKSAGENFLVANKDGAVTLYYDSLQTFETKSAGIEISHAGSANTSRFLSGGSVGVGIGVTTTTGRDAVGAAGTVKGQIVYNETDSVVQVYNGTGWDQLSNVPTTATGGDTTAGVAPGNGYQYHVFTSPGSLTVAGGEATADMLLVAGGGGGTGGMGSNNHGGGGGGAGGIAEVVSMPLPAGTYPVTVPTSRANGSGGNTGINAGHGQGGGNVTVASTPVGTITANGGGGGGSGPSNAGGDPGGSGGGGGSFGGTPGGSATQPGTNPSPLVTDYGNAGGQAGDSSADASAAGGGGAGGSGQGTGEPNVAGNGGSGRNFSNYPYPLYSPIVPSPFQPEMGPVVGTNGTFGGGGGGGQGTSGSGGNAGSGGGGEGGVAGNPVPGQGDDAKNGTGGGGGGGGGGQGGEGGNGADGGRGILIMRLTL